MWLDDSKQVTKARRRALRPVILGLAVNVSEVVISVAEIDGGGVDEANYRALREAVSGLEPAPEKCFIDWYDVPGCRYPTTRLVGGDSKSAAVAAASIIAKTTRDELMVRAAAECPGWGFESHKGYSSPKHREALRYHRRLTRHHRRSIDPPIYRELGLAGSLKP
jgi:ribonuclease HII